MEIQSLPVQLTDEQDAIIRSTGNIRINAVAGSGKTTTVIHYAATRPPNSRILYLAFNRSVKNEAQKRFAKLHLKNVRVETAHSLAYNYIARGSNYNITTAGYNSYDIARLLSLSGNGEKHGEFILATHVLKFLTCFCNSSASRVQDVDYRKAVSDKQALLFVNNFYHQIEKATRILLGMMHRGEIDITHDFYLKMFQLSAPTLNYDFIMFDEGQDASPAMLSVFLNQQSQKIIVGDANQQIYGWRHAINSLEAVDFPAFDLSATFRFSQHIADLAMKILDWKSHLQNWKPVYIEGRGQKAPIKTRATIGRTNLGLLISAISFIRENRHAKQIYFEGNINSYTYADEGASLYDVLNLYTGKRSQIRNRLIASMHSLKELEEYISKTEDMQLGMMVEVVKEYGNEIPALIQQLKNMHVSDDNKSAAEMIFSTVHRAKGMEYDEVTLTDDFITEKDIMNETRNEAAALAKINEEINLLYVAVTRTKQKLNIPASLLPLCYLDEQNQLSTDLPEDICLLEKTDTNTKKASDKETASNKPPSYSYIEKRRKNKNAYERWSAETDSELKTLFYKGMSIADLSEHFGRNKGAIASRLKKIGCNAFD